LELRPKTICKELLGLSRFLMTFPFGMRIAK
jgi:hypothetical protein